MISECLEDKTGEVIAQRAEGDREGEKVAEGEEGGEGGEGDEAQSKKKKKKKKKKADQHITGLGSLLIVKIDVSPSPSHLPPSSVPLSPTCTDILLLYSGVYQEPSDPKPVCPQTDPPSVPIADLYAGQTYPVGQEMTYPVS